MIAKEKIKHKINNFWSGVVETADKSTYAGTKRQGNKQSQIKTVLGLVTILKAHVGLEGKDG